MRGVLLLINWEEKSASFLDMQQLDNKVRYLQGMHNAQAF